MEDPVMEPPCPNDHEIVLRIQELLDGVEWQATLLEEIARLLTESGYPVRDIEA
jgi:hypothetical protein